MDVIALHQAGFTNSIACLGTALTQEQARLVARYTDEVVLSYDSDEAGQKATKRAIGIFGETGVKIRVLKLTGGKDPDEIIKNYGKQRFQNLLDGAANDIEYGILREREKYDIETIDGKSKFLTAVAEILSNGNSIEQDMYATKLATEMSVGKDAIMQEIKNAYKRRIKNQNREQFKEIVRDTVMKKDEINPERSKHIKAAKAEETLIATIMLNPDFYFKVKARVTDDIFVTEFNRRVWNIISDRLENGREIDLLLLSLEFTPEEMGRITQLVSMRDKLSNTVAECDDCINVLEKEKNKMSVSDVSQLSNDEFRNLFKNPNGS